MTMPDLNSGALAPVADEVEIFDLPVIGDIPSELRGTLIRNGPNPFSGQFSGADVLSWWPEAAMLHAISFVDGAASVYRNRWVRSANWASHHKIASDQLPIDTNPNVNVISHAGEVLALAEGGLPVAINSELETLGPARNHIGFSSGMTAHPKMDSVTRELVTFRADWAQPWLKYGVFDAAGKATLEQEIAIVEPAMMHDMAITQSHSILLDLNVGYDFSMLQRGYRMPIRWQEDRGSRLGVLPRHGGNIRWFEIEPCFIQHVVNAYDGDDDTITLDVVRYPWYFRENPERNSMAENPLGVLWRYTIDPKRNRITEQQLDDRHIELPRINESHTGQLNRYFYGVEQPTNEEMRGVIRYDLVTGTTQHHEINAPDQNSEPVFVPSAQGSNEDDGWVLFSVYKAATQTNEILILDARDISQPPLASVQLNRRIPAGFHGAWLPGVDSR
jgi:carotenoid cleavage dioxygenase-like enzyme